MSHLFSGLCTFAGRATLATLSTALGNRAMNAKTKVVSVTEAKAQFSRLLQRAHRGETILLSKAGKPYARLAPLENAVPRKPGALKGKFKLTRAFFDPMPKEELRLWEGS